MSSTGVEGVKMKAILQQCLGARLQTHPGTEESPPQFVEIGRGLVVYICFLQGANEELVEKMVKNVMNCRLSRSENEKLVSILELPGSVLIVPQATLGGKLKGKAMQYHTNISKDIGLELYMKFVEECKTILGNSPKAKEASCTVQCGTYGNLQVLKLDTNGPFSHILEL